MEAPPKSLHNLAVLRRSIQHVLLGGLAAPLAAVALGLHVATLLRGRNLADVGAPRWEHGDLAFAAGAASFVAVLAGGWYLERLLTEPLPRLAVVLGWGVRLTMGAVFLLAIRAQC